MDSNPDIVFARILVVEDEPFQRRILAAVLKSKGFGRICEASSSSAAIAMLESELINTVVSDVEMPGMNGLELLRQIRTGQTAARRDVGFIILTSHSNTEVLSAAMALDVNGFIVKPFTTRVILEKIMRTRRESISLRSESEYAAVVTDLASLRTARVLGSASSEPVAASASDDVADGRITLPIAELRVGMRVASNVTAIDDRVIVAAETTLSTAIINLISDLKELVAGGVVTIYDSSLESKVEQ
jgi:CheY-like chemotaxis protein